MDKVVFNDALFEFLRDYKNTNEFMKTVLSVQL
jgi:hypothetical protein